MNYFIDAIMEAENPEKIFDMIGETAGLAISQEFVMKDLGLTSRIFNNWIKTGLVTNCTKEGDYKYTFSFIDLIWFNIVSELRGYGFPIEKIKIVNKKLMEPVLLLETLNNPNPKKKSIVNKKMLGEEFKEKAELATSLNEKILGRKKNPDGFKVDISIIPLHLLVSRFLFDRSDIRIMIDINGNVFPCTKNTPLDHNLYEMMNEAGFDSNSFISISLLKFIGKFIQKGENRDFSKNNNFINENEQYILSLIREGKAKSITIKFESKKPRLIEITEEKKLNVEARISEVILKRGYQDIKITTKDGSMVYSNIVTKKKLF